MSFSQFFLKKLEFHRDGIFFHEFLSVEHVPALSATLLLFRGDIVVQNRGVLLVTSGKNMECRMDFFSCPSKGVWDGIIWYSMPKGFVLEVAYKTKKHLLLHNNTSSIQHIISWLIEFNIVFITSSRIHLVAKNILHEACRISKNIKNGLKITKVWPIKVWWLSSPSQCQALMG